MAELITAGCKVAGGPWFVFLRLDGEPSVQLGPYENPGLAKDDARALQKFLAAALRRGEGKTGETGAGNK